MSKKDLRRNMAVFPIGSVMKLTDLTARQIRYYEDFNLIQPHRSDTNRRLYSLNDIDRLLEIVELMDEGLTLKGIQKKFDNDLSEARNNQGDEHISKNEMRRILRNEIGF